MKKLHMKFPLILFSILIVFSIIGCSKEEPDFLSLSGSEDGFSLSGKYNDNEFTFGTDDSSESENPVEDFINEYGFAVAVGLGVLILFIVIFKLASLKDKKTDNRYIPIEEVKISNSEPPVSEEIARHTNEDTTLIEKMLEELKNYHVLFSNDVYSISDFNEKKHEWFERLKSRDNVDESTFLNKLLPLIKENILSQEEVSKVKYIISGNYRLDKIKELEERKRIQEENEKLKRQEVINNAKNRSVGVVKTVVRFCRGTTINLSNKFKTWSPIVSKNLAKAYHKFLDWIRKNNKLVIIGTLSVVMIIIALNLFNYVNQQPPSNKSVSSKILKELSLNNNGTEITIKSVDKQDDVYRYNVDVDIEGEELISRQLYNVEYQKIDNKWAFISAIPSEGITYIPTKGVNEERVIYDFKQSGSNFILAADWKEGIYTAKIVKEELEDKHIEATVTFSYSNDLGTMSGETEVEYKFEGQSWVLEDINQNPSSNFVFMNGKELKPTPENIKDALGNGKVKIGNVSFEISSDLVDITDNITISHSDNTHVNEDVSSGINFENADYKASGKFTLPYQYVDGSWKAIQDKVSYDLTFTPKKPIPNETIISALEGQLLTVASEYDLVLSKDMVKQIEVTENKLSTASDDSSISQVTANVIINDGWITTKGTLKLVYKFIKNNWEIQEAEIQDPHSEINADIKKSYSGFYHIDEQDDSTSGAFSVSDSSDGVFVDNLRMVITLNGLNPEGQIEGTMIISHNKNYNASSNLSSPILVTVTDPTELTLLIKDYMVGTSLFGLQSSYNVSLSMDTFTFDITSKEMSGSIIAEGELDGKWSSGESLQRQLTFNLN